MTASVQDLEFESRSLGERRGVTVFLPTDRSVHVPLPVLFCADGQSVHGFAEHLSREIDRGYVPPIVLIGVHSDPRRRAQEYLSDVEPQLFDAHERFFAGQILDWARRQYGVAKDRQFCGVFGFSNGGAFALSMGARQRDKFGVVIAFSIAGGADRVPEAEYARRPIPRYYLSAGTREKPFRNTGRVLARMLSKQGVKHHSTERAAGHDFDFWAAELPEAIRWAFSGGSLEEKSGNEPNFLKQLATFVLRRPNS